jgi:hypothetical protein
VLRGAYRLERGAVIAALEGLMAIRQVHLEQEDLVCQALAWQQQGLSFAAALHLLRSEGWLHQLRHVGSCPDHHRWQPGPPGSDAAGLRSATAETAPSGQH